MKILFILCSALLALGGLTACNTMRGIGEDISAFGRYLSSSSGTTPTHSTPPPPTAPY